jgi:uncharacterized membrane protein YcaP (DUF421 family)
MDFGTIDWSAIFRFTVSPLALVLRGTLVYWFLFLVLRLVLKRDAGSVGVTDFLFVVLLGDAAQNAMIGEASSTSDGIVLIATLVGWNLLLDWASYRFPFVERLSQGSRLCLYRDGRLQHRNLRREYITLEELRTKLHEHELHDFSELDSAYMEPNGEITVIPAGRR